MGPFGVVVGAPSGQHGASTAHRRDSISFKNASRKATIEAHDEGALCRFTECDVMPSILRSSAKIRYAFKVNSIPLSLTSVTGLPRFPSISVASSCATSGRVGDQGQAFPSAISDQGQ